ncbi:Oidioi.mRNA.OKI2018_I69.XSR.g15730.t1.cds [Oikopleura dioica]|uniref:Oidioi.mRNA.OKI2018_I69.XSR.g15730.t1.cds n=1 Tax=Oikopleura dioica TaxID=34765 RepID=A0ABN7SDQ5_OIKDI|nr:Oidioi.mRNA.OKI2018_I69.XSR.g15730.t1.cds [Oikopleura dioica]
MGATKRGRSAAGTKRKAVEPTRKSDRAKRSYVPRDDDGVIVQVLGSKKINGVEHFQVKWSDDVRPKSWEPAKNVLKVAKSLVDDYQANEPASDQKPAQKKSKAAPKRGQSAKRTKKSSADSESNTVVGRSIKDGRVEYKFKKSGKTKTIPLHKLDEEELEAVQKYERKIKKGDFPEELSTEGASSAGPKVFNVEKILDRKGSGKNRRYLIKWEGYNSHHNTWEPITNIEPARKMAKAFDKKQDALDEEEATKDFEVEKIVEEKIRRNKPCFLVKWKGFNRDYNTWQSADSLADCSEILAAWESVKQKRLESQRQARERREKRKEERKVQQAKEKAEAAEKAAKESAASSGKESAPEKKPEDAAKEK